MKLNPSLSQRHLTLLLWLWIYVALWLQSIAQTTMVQATITPLMFLLSAYPFTTYLSESLLLKAMEKKQWPLFAIQYLLFSTVTGLIFLAYSILLFYLEQNGYLPHSGLFSTKKHLMYNVLVFITSSMIINLCFCGLSFYRENLKLHKDLVGSQLQMLQEQINPHFMFNVLNHVHVLIRKDPSMADSLLLQYTDILRYQLYSTKKEYITIEQEVTFLKNFIEVEKVRWKNKLDVSSSWKVEDGGLRFRPLLLITFIENAFKHVSLSVGEKNYINIHFEQQGNRVCLSVENSKSPVAQKLKASSGIGLKNVKRRLDILLMGRYNLEINDTEKVYLTQLAIDL